MVAACNPHRGNSLAAHRHSWVRGTYYVRPLHPTLQLLKWDYGSLDDHQERDYIRAKIELMVELKNRTRKSINEPEMKKPEVHEVQGDEIALKDIKVTLDEASKKTNVNQPEAQEVAMDEVEVRLISIISPSIVQGGSCY